MEFLDACHLDGGGFVTLGKIFRYECRRLLWNKFFIGLAVVLLLYGAFVLHAVTILGVAHTAPFSPLELWGLPLPDNAPAVDRDAVLFDLLYLTQCPAGGRPHGRRADAAQALRFGPVCRGPDRGSAADLAVYGGGSGVLRPYVSLVQLGEPAAPGLGDPSAGPGICLGQRLAGRLPGR